MIVEFHDADRMFGLKAIGIYQKAIETAVAACDKVYVPTVELQTANAAADAARSWIADSLDEMGIGEVRELTMPSDLCVALRTAASCYLTQLGKLAEKQSDLLVPLEDTNVLMSRLTSLSDRLSGQTEIAGTVTISVSGHEPVTLAADDMANITRSLGRTAKGTAKTQRETVDAS